MAKTIHIDTKTFVRFWLVIAILIIVAALLLKASTALIIIAIAAFLAVAITPLMKKVNKLIGRKKSRPGLASGITVGGLFVIVLTIIAVAGPVVVKQTSDFVANAPEQLQSSLSQMSFIDTIGERFGITTFAPLKSPFSLPSCVTVPSAVVEGSKIFGLISLIIERR